MRKEYENHQTRAVSYWLDDDQDFWDDFLPEMVKYSKSLADLADEIHDYVTCSMNDEIDGANYLVSDLIGYCLRRVDWYELASVMSQEYEMFHKHKVEEEERWTDPERYYMTER